jgi:hypothetical protein
MKFFASLVGRMVWDAFLAALRKVSWGVVLERAASRMLVGLLRFLVGLTTNTLDDDAADEIIKQLTKPGTGLPEVERTVMRLKNEKK